jgi:hypothetical protein
MRAQKRGHFINSSRGVRRRKGEIRKNQTASAAMGRWASQRQQRKCPCWVVRLVRHSPQFCKVAATPGSAPIKGDSVVCPGGPQAPEFTLIRINEGLGLGPTALLLLLLQGGMFLCPMCSSRLDRHTKSVKRCCTKIQQCCTFVFHS